MKILYVFSGEKAQGAEIVIERLMTCNAAKVQPHLFIAPGKFAETLLKTGKPYPITTLPELRRLFRSTAKAFSFYAKAIGNHFKVSSKVYRYLKKEKINIIHANNIVAASYLIPVIIYAKIFMPKKIWLWSDHDMGYASRLDTMISKITRRVYDCTLAVSDAVAKKYAGLRKVKVLYNGLDPELFKPDSHLRENFRIKLNISANAILLGMAGKITPGKGHAGLIEVFNRLTNDFPHACLMLAGSYADDHPAYGDQIKQAIAANKNIIYTGFLDDVIPYYNGCDIIVSNSDKSMSESLGTTIYEAMAFEKIVVASDIGGTPEIITDDVDGFLFAAEKQDELYLQLFEAIERSASLDKMRKMAREKVNKNFNIFNMAEKYNRVINKLLELKA